MVCYLLHWTSRWIIEKIFDLASHGMGAAKITKTLIEEKVPTSAWQNFQKYGTFAHIFEGQPESKRYLWTIGQVKNLMKDEKIVVHDAVANTDGEREQEVEIYYRFIGKID